MRSYEHTACSSVFRSVGTHLEKFLVQENFGEILGPVGRENLPHFMDNYHLTKTKEGPWALKREGAQRATQTFAGLNKTESIQAAAAKLKSMSSPASLKIHGVDGRIKQERTYPRSADPTKSPS